MWSLRSEICTSFAGHFIGVSLGVKPSLCGLYKLCKAFYRRQFGCEAFALRSVQALQGISYWVWSLRSEICTNFARRFIGVSLGVKPSLCGLYKLCNAFYSGSLGVKPSLCGLYKLCKAFYRCQFGCEAFALKSAQALQGILQVSVWVWSLRSAVCTSFAKHFIGGSLGVKLSLFGLYKLCRASLGVKPSLWNLHKLCRAFYRCQFGCEAFALQSVQALQGIL